MFRVWTGIKTAWMAVTVELFERRAIDDGDLPSLQIAPASITGAISRARSDDLAVLDVMREI